MVIEVEEQYNKLSKKYKLPKFKELNEEFEISDIDDVSFLLRNILRKIADKLEFYSNLINDLLQPDMSSLSGVHEISFLSEIDKNNMYALFKKIMKAYRNINLLVLENDKKSQTRYLSSFYVEWLEIKKQLINYLSIMKDSWDKEANIEENLGYLG